MQYRAGTVTVANNSPLVRGDGSLWLSAVEPGAMFAIVGERVPYTVAAINGDTELLLSAPYQGISKTGAFYLIQTSFTPLRGYPVPEQGDVDAILVVARAIQEIDADIPEAGSGARLLDDLQDVAAAGATTGNVLTKLADGSFGFSEPGIVSVDAVNLGTDGSSIYKDKTGSTFQFRRLKVTGGGTISENVNDLTIALPPAGEANTASNVGTAASVGVFRQKLGTNLQFRGLRSGSGITITDEGTDIVVTATGGGATGGEANTASNLGTGAVQVYRQKVGADLRFRSITFDATRFQTDLSTDGNVYTVSFRPLSITDLGGASLGAATTGQYLRKDADGIWKGAELPSSGIASVQADTNPTLGGNLNINNKSIVGLLGIIPGFIERPKNKDYVVAISLPYSISITGMNTSAGAGSTGWQVRVNGSVLGATPGAETDTFVGGLQGQSGETVSLQNVVATLTGSKVSVTLVAPTADCADFAFGITYMTAGQ